MRQSRLLLDILLLFFLGGVILGAIKSSVGAAPSALDIKATSFDGTGRMITTVTIHDPTGIHLSDIDKTHVQVYVAGVEQELSALIDHEQPKQMSLALAIDTSGSMRHRLKLARDAASRFLDKLPPGTRYGIYSFNDKPVNDFTFSSNISQAQQAIHGLMHGGRYTALYDTIFLALKDLQQEKATSRILVVLTDGKDENSDKSLDNCLTLAGEIQFPLFTIAMGRKVYEKPLLKLAQFSGGKFFSQNASKEKGLDRFFNEISSFFKKTVGSYRIQIDEPELAVNTESATLKIMINKDQFHLENEVEIQYSEKSTTARKKQLLKRPEGQDKITTFSLLWIILGILLFAGSSIIIFILTRKRAPLRHCPKCGLVIPEYLEECLDCSDIEEYEEVKKDEAVLKKEFIDTEPAMAALEERLDKTLILLDIPILALMSGRKILKTFDLSTIDEITAGRSDVCDILLSDKSISSCHAKISQQGDNYYLEDLGSTNGTFVNEKRVIREKIKLNFGDAIRMGQTQFIFKLDQRKPM
ncbi:FHA domain-containing protein [candidate division CSSED10-310 bacterium]|uniref:FHA domain-containing protein n=1 Tax=candidate division CSSED10-310 bacterium TaxID=2855610 RepID=A0ABV6YS48_UNCC1